MGDQSQAGSGELQSARITNGFTERSRPVGFKVHNKMSRRLSRVDYSSILQLIDKSNEDGAINSNNDEDVLEVPKYKMFLMMKQLWTRAVKRKILKFIKYIE